MADSKLEQALTGLRNAYNTDQNVVYDALKKNAVSKSIAVSEWNMLLAQIGHDAPNIKRLKDFLETLSVEVVGTGAIPDNYANVTDAITQLHSMLKDEVYVGSSEPTDDRVRVWVDPSDSSNSVQERIENSVNYALTVAKESGVFDGKDGKDGVDGKDGFTPEKGVDYLTPEDISKFLERAYPVGAMYMSGVSEDPANILGFGTWKSVVTPKTALYTMGEFASDGTCVVTADASGFYRVTLIGLETPAIKAYQTLTNPDFSDSIYSRQKDDGADNWSVYLHVGRNVLKYSGTPPKFARFELTHACDVVSYLTAKSTNNNNYGVHGMQLNPSIGGSNSALVGTLQVPESAEYCLDVFAHSMPGVTVKFTLTPQDGSATVELASTDVGSSGLSGSTLSFTHHKLTTCKLNANVKYDVYAFVQKGYLNVNSVFIVNPTHTTLTTPVYIWQRTE